MSRLVVGITGASMPQLGIRMLQALQALRVETHVVISTSARRTIALEAPDWTVGSVQALADVAHQPDDIAASIASGSFLTDGMVVIPCSMNKAAAIAHSMASDLLTRAADVTLKEGRRLVLVPRESVLHLGHMRNLTAAAELGARIVPPVLGAYYGPRSIDDVLDHLVGRILDLFGIENMLVNRWSGPIHGGCRPWPGRSPSSREESGSRT